MSTVGAAPIRGITVRVAVAQIAPIPGAIRRNVVLHRGAVEIAAGEGVDLLAFPELSLSGYEPSLAANLAMTIHDDALSHFAVLAEQHAMAIVVGFPRSDADTGGVQIAAGIFRPGAAPADYAKRHLDSDEESIFVPGREATNLIATVPPVALAICYEISFPLHPRAAKAQGAGIYLASVAKTARGAEEAHERLSAVALEHEMTVLMANCLGPCGGNRCVGRSAVWRADGTLAEEIEGDDAALLGIDTRTEETFRAAL